MADSTLSNLTSLTLPSQATDLLLVGRGTARPNKVAMSDALNSAALAATTGAYGVVQLAASGGTTAGTVVQATDARLSDTRNPPDGSKGDIVVSGSGSTWTIKTDPTLSGTVSAGIVRVGDGTAAAPSLSFTNDSDTGFYKVPAATDIVYFAAGGQPSLRLVSGGYLYSGTINSYLQMAGTGAISLVADVTTNQNVSLSASGTGAVVLNATNILFRSQSGASEWARFNNVGTLTIATGTDSGNGKIQLGTHTTIAGGIGFGTDVSLYRNFSNQLSTNAGAITGGVGMGYFSLIASGASPLTFNNGNGESFRVSVSRGLNVGGTTDIGPGSISATGKITAQSTTAFPYEGQLLAINSSPSGTNSAVSQAILQAQPGYTTFVGTTADGTTASYRTGGLGGVVAAVQSYLIGDGANGMLLHSINGPTIFATQNTGSEKMRLASNGNLLIGKTVDNALGRLQVSGAVTMEEAAGTGLFGFFGGSTLVYGSLASNPVVIRTNNTAALTLDTSQNATFAGKIIDPGITGTILEDIFTITDAAAFEVDPGNGSIQLITLGASRTPKATNFAAGESITLMVNDGTAYTLTWTDATWGTGGVAWVGGSAPTLATTGYTVIQFWKVGTQVYGARVGDVA